VVVVVVAMTHVPQLGRLLLLIWTMTIKMTMTSLGSGL